MKYPDRWNVNEEWWGSAVQTLTFNFNIPNREQGAYFIRIESAIFKEMWREAYEIVSEKEVMIDGVAGLRIVATFKPTNEQEIFVLFKKEENTFRIKGEELLDTIVSTFRFLE